MKENMENNMKEICVLCNQEHEEEFKDCGIRLPQDTSDKDTPSSVPRISRDADNGAAIVSGHAEEG
jgi:hypothetical protein